MPLQQEQYMKEALALAWEAAEAGEVPVGCVIEEGWKSMVGYRVLI